MPDPRMQDYRASEYGNQMPGYRQADFQPQSPQPMTRGPIGQNNKVLDSQVFPGQGLSQEAVSGNQDSKSRGLFSRIRNSSPKLSPARNNSPEQVQASKGQSRGLLGGVGSYFKGVASAIFGRSRNAGPQASPTIANNQGPSTYLPPEQVIGDESVPLADEELSNWPTQLASTAQPAASYNRGYSTNAGLGGYSSGAYPSNANARGQFNDVLSSMNDSLSQKNTAFDQIRTSNNKTYPLGFGAPEQSTEDGFGIF
ncbi:MAG: hypothetical protein ACK481_02830 [Candidatus Melainabacteria bacterium]|jgi:hypothetical protein